MTQSTEVSTTKRRVELDNAIVVDVVRMSEQDMLRAASIFDPEKAEKLQASGDNVNPRDMLDLWRGNERYLLYIVECACTLVTPYPPEAIPGRIRRNADLYGVVADDLVYQDYAEAVYIRFVGMTNEEFVNAVSGFAMGIEETAAPAARGKRRSRLLESANEGNVQAR